MFGRNFCLSVCSPSCLSVRLSVSSPSLFIVFHRPPHYEHLSLSLHLLPFSSYPVPTASAAFLFCLFLRLDFPCLAAFEPFPPVCRAHGLINNKDTKPKCRLYWCLKGLSHEIDFHNIAKN